MPEFHPRRRLLMRRVLLLRRVERDIDSLLVFRHVEDLPERLEPFGDHLYADLALRDLRDLGFALLVGPQFVSGAEFLDVEDGMAPDEPDHHAGVVDGTAGLGLHHHVELGHGHRRRPGRRSPQQQHGREEQTNKPTPHTHAPIL